MERGEDGRWKGNRGYPIINIADVDRKCGCVQWSAAAKRLAEAEA